MWSLNPGRRESHISSQSVHTGLENPAFFFRWVQSVLSPRINGQRHSAVHSYHPYVVPKLGVSRAIPLLFLHAFVVYTRTNARLKENVFLFRCSRYIRTKPRTPEGNQHKRKVSPSKRSLTWIKEKGQKFNIQRAVHRDIFLSWKPTRCTIYQINLRNTASRWLLL
jgi:hypothetical protein